MQPQELLEELKPGMARGSGHSSRVFSVKFHPDDSNVIVSGGWVSALLSNFTRISSRVKAYIPFPRVGSPARKRLIYVPSTIENTTSNGGKLIDSDSFHR